MKSLIAYTYLLFIFFQFTLHCQTFNFVNLPHSAYALGTGWQGVASLTNDDALVYNPAKLSLTKNTRLSFFRNPFQMWGGSMPFTNLALYYKVTGIGSFGISYEYWDEGEFNITSEVNPNIIEEKFHYYESSFSIGYARNFGNSLSAGIQLRYAYSHLYQDTPSGFFIGLGMLYNPDFCDKRFDLGLSIMNLGSAVEYNSLTPYGEPDIFYDSPPTRLNLGMNYIAIDNDYLTLPLDLSISKPFDKRDDNGEGESSFKTLFSDWSDFPDDMSLHSGISLIWKPLNLGKNFSFFQEFYFGNYSQGIKTYLLNYYTHGVNIGIEFNKYKLCMGYSGISHDVNYLNYSYYFPWEFPYETFQFSFEVNDDLLFKRNTVVEKKPALDGIILSFGSGETVRTGVWKSFSTGIWEHTTENSLSYIIEAAFYINENNALVSSLHFNSVPFKVTSGTYTAINSTYEDFTFFTSYRYHPLQSFHYLFVQGGLGIFRMNPVPKSSPRYDYKTAVQLGAGLTLDLGDPVILTPDINYNLIFERATGPAPRIQGFNQFNFILKVGYKIL